MFFKFLPHWGGGVITGHGGIILKNKGALMATLIPQDLVELLPNCGEMGAKSITGHIGQILKTKYINGLADSFYQEMFTLIKRLLTSLNSQFDSKCL